MIKKNLFTIQALISVFLLHSCGSHVEEAMEEEVNPKTFMGPSVDEESPETSNDPQGLKEKINPGELPGYGIVVDIFRKGGSNPPLGNYKASYADYLKSDVVLGNDPAQNDKILKSKFDKLAQNEFAIVSIDGIPVKAYLVSGGRQAYVRVAKKDANGKKVYDENGNLVMVNSFKSTPNGIYPLTVYKYNVKLANEEGKKVTQKIPFPFLTSTTYDASPMFWGLNVVGGILIHATPHYGELGRPASMGCLRQSLPDAMELFDLVANKNEGRKAAIQIHAMGSSSAVKRLRQLVFDPEYLPATGDQTVYANASSARQISWVVDQLITNQKNIKNVIQKRKSSEVYLGAHAWLDPTTKAELPLIYPKCGPVDCIETWGEPMKIYKRRKAQLSTGL